MVIPKKNNIYLYKGNKYIVRYCALIDPIMTVQTLTEENQEYSTFENISYWNFALKAKHIGELKLSEAY